MEPKTNPESTDLHLIYGSGPAACWTAHYLISQGVRVKAVNRSGKRPALMSPKVQMVQADLLDLEQAIEVTRGASVVYQLLGPAYAEWAEKFPRLQANTIEAASRFNSAYVALENLYMMDASVTMTESSPEKPLSQKGKVRQAMSRQLMDAHRQGNVHVSVLRSSDFYGPGVTASAMGERFFVPLLKASAAQVLMKDDCLHSFAFIGDVGRSLAHLGLADRGHPTWGGIWLAPHAAAQTQRAWVEAACLLIKRPTKLMIVKPWLLRLIGLINADAKASLEMMYQFEQPFIVDSRVSEQVLGVTPTPIAQGLQLTIDWYRHRAVGVKALG